MHSDKAKQNNQRRLLSCGAAPELPALLFQIRLGPAAAQPVAMENLTNVTLEEAFQTLQTATGQSERTLTLLGRP